ncbi:MAG: hypothetical protein ABIN79_11065 [Marmoricola sp.]
MKNTEKTSRKILIPLATMLVAGAVAVGSGATFTSQSASAVAVTSGILKHANDKNAQTLTAVKLKPGDVQTGSLKITNDGTLDSTLTLQETADASTFTAGDLKLEITQAGVATPLFTGNFGALDNTTKVDLGALPVGASTTVTFKISMPQTAGNENQAKSASASYQYVTTQSGDNSSISWLP